jgi:hypothetical protein
VVHALAKYVEIWGKVYMIIDSSKWNEYISDDTPPGPMPEGIRIETMWVTTAIGYKEPSVDGIPSGVPCDPNTVKHMRFWRHIQ